jgi:hypothetical protein
MPSKEPKRIKLPRVTYALARKFGWGDSPASREWLQRLASIQVEPKPAGRAILREPGAPFRAEIRFLPARRGLSVTDIRLVAEDPNFDWWIDFDAMLYVLAWDVYVDLHADAAPRALVEFSRMPVQPEPGKRPDLRQYRTLVAAYDALVLQGVRDPARRLADQSGLNYNTVKSRLRRGRKYIKEEGKK